MCAGVARAAHLLCESALCRAALPCCRPPHLIVLSTEPAPPGAGFVDKVQSVGTLASAWGSKGRPLSPPHPLARCAPPHSVLTNSVVRRPLCPEPPCSMALPTLLRAVFWLAQRASGGLRTLRPRGTGGDV